MSRFLSHWPVIFSLLGLVAGCGIAAGGYDYGGGYGYGGGDYYEPDGFGFGGWGPGYDVAPFGYDHRFDHRGDFGRGMHAFRGAPGGRAMPSLPGGRFGGGGHFGGGHGGGGFGGHGGGGGHGGR